jgi:tRNA dimethylallyltransferase
LSEPPRPKVLVILGPTGTGKTALGISLAQSLRGEILGCDSLQIYRRFNIGTAKPSARERLQATHHLIDCVDPEVHFSVADYVREADRIIAEIAQRGAVPIIVGGSGMYLRALLRGLIEVPARNERVRERLQRILQKRGIDTLYRSLRRRDPASAERLAATDTQRIVRALEIALVAETSWSERLATQGTWRGGPERYPSLKIGLRCEPPELRERLDRRVETFFRDGLTEEVSTLLEEGVPRTANAFKAIGYREILGQAAGSGKREELISLVQRNTRRYAKRQRTWFRKERDVCWIDALQSVETLTEIVLENWDSE